MDQVFYRPIGFSFSVHYFRIHSNFIYIFSALRTNTFTFISLCMDHVLMAKILRFQLRHYTCLIKLTLLQLRHRTSLTKLMFNTRAPLMFTTRAHYIHVTCSKLPLFHSNILFHSPVSVHLQIRPVSQLIYHLLSPHSIISPTCLPSPNTYGTLRLYYFSPTTSRLTQERDQLIKTQCFAAYVPTKLTKIRHLPAPSRIVMRDAIKLAMAYLFIKLAMRKILVTL